MIFKKNQTLILPNTNVNVLEQYYIVPNMLRHINYLMTEAQP